MNKNALRKIFDGYDDVIFTDNIPEVNCFNICTSPDKVKDNSLLFITEKADGAIDTFDTSRLKSRPAAIVASKAQALSSDTIPTIRVGNARTALSYALSNFYGIDYDKVKIIGITGTNGKTTTATLIYKILTASGYKAGFIGTGKIEINGVTVTDNKYSMTTPDPTELYPAISDMISKGCQYVVMEVSSHSIALGKIAPIKFSYAIFTNLDNDHLDFHKTKDEYFETKLKLFNSAKQGLFNLDDEYSSMAYRRVKCNRSSFGIINQGDAYATEIDIGGLCNSSFYYREKGLIFRAKTRLCGAFNVYNSLCALKCVIDLGIKPCIAKKALETIEKIDGRMEIINDDITVIIDYAHTPSAFYNSLKTLKQSIKNGQNMIAVFGCGGDRDKTKRPLFGKYASSLADKIIITEDNCRTESFDSIVFDIISGIKKAEYEVIRDREEAIRHAIRCARCGDVVAIIGKGHEKYKIVGKEYLPFDERGIVEDELIKIKKSYANNS